MKLSRQDRNAYPPRLVTVSLIALLVIVSLGLLFPGLAWIHDEEFSRAFWSGLYSNLISGTYTGIVTGIVVGIILWRMQLSFQDNMVRQQNISEVDAFNNKI